MQMQNMSKGELEDRYEELVKTARENFIEQSRFSVFDWLCEEDRIEFERIQFLLGESDYNPDE